MPFSKLTCLDIIFKSHNCEPKATIKKEVANMKIKLNPDQEIVNTIREGLKRTGGYCPCLLYTSSTGRRLIRKETGNETDHRFSAAGGAAARRLRHADAGDRSARRAEHKLSLIHI